jgi:hypothetical protein
LGIGRAGGGATWPRVCGRRSPCRRGFRGQRGLFPFRDSPGEHARAAARRPCRAGGAAILSGARNAAVRTPTGMEREKVRGRR